MKKYTLAGLALLGMLEITQIAVAEPPGTTECTTPTATTVITGNVDVPAGGNCVLLGTIVIGNVTVEGSLIAEPNSISGIGTIIAGTLQGNQASNILLIGAPITGNVTVGGSSTALPSPISGIGTIIGGNLQGNQASGIALVGSIVIGNVQANQTTSTSDMLRANYVCGSTVGGNLQIQQSGVNAPWFIQDVSTVSLCPGGPNTIRGDLQFQNNAARGLIDGNNVGGNLVFQNNNNKTETSGDVSSNTISGNLQCQGNNQPPTGNSGTNMVRQQKSGQCEAF